MGAIHAPRREAGVDPAALGTQPRWQPGTRAPRQGQEALRSSGHTSAQPDSLPRWHPSPRGFKHLKERFPFKKDAESKKSTRGKSFLLQWGPSSCARKGESCGGWRDGPAQALLGLLDHPFAKVCHFGILHFLLVQLILSPQ